MRKEVKSWEECKQEEKEELLKHWFIYYGNTLVTLDEIEAFAKLTKTKADKIFDSLIPLYITRNTIQSGLLVASMIEGYVDELLDYKLPEEAMNPEVEEAIKGMRRILFEEIKGTYFEPEPPVPMDVIIEIKDNKKNY